MKISDMQLFLLSITFLATIALIAGIVLVAKGYSSSAPFSIAAACVGVLGTLAGERFILESQRNNHGS